MQLKERAVSRAQNIAITADCWRSLGPARAATEASTSIRQWTSSLAKEHAGVGLLSNARTSSDAVGYDVLKVSQEQAAAFVSDARFDEGRIWMLVRCFSLSRGRVALLTYVCPVTRTCCA